MFCCLVKQAEKAAVMSLIAISLVLSGALTVGADDEKEDKARRGGRDKSQCTAESRDRSYECQVKCGLGELASCQAGKDRHVTACECRPDSYASLISQMKEWRNDPRYVNNRRHTKRWDQALRAFGEPVSDTTLTAMTDSEAQELADEEWGGRWVPVARALKAVKTGTSNADGLHSTSGGSLLVGLDGNDRLQGYGGNDELRGGDGDDNLSGGPGADRFTFFSGEKGNNTITDFAPGDVVVMKGDSWAPVSDIIAGAKPDNGKYVYELGEGLAVKTNVALKERNFVME